MPYEAEQLALRLWVKEVANRLGILGARLPVIPDRWRLTILIGALAAYAFFLRCAHLINSNHYPIISPDSYFFHWLAQRVMAGEGLPPDAPSGTIYTWHTGLTYPIAYIAKAVGSLDLVVKFLPPILAIISMVLIYLVATKLYNRRVALLSSFAWAGILNAVFIGGAGYIDRDGLSMLLIMTGVFLFYLSKGWQFLIGGRDIGWLLAGLGVLIIEGILYLEWVALGPILLVAILVVYCVARFMLEYSDLLRTEPSAMRRLSAAAKTINWQTFALIIAVNIVIVAASHSQAADWLNLATGGFRTEEQNPASEMQGLGFLDLLNYHFFLIPMVVGLYITWKRRDEGGILFSSWIIFLLATSLFATRLLLYALPAACFLAGTGLDSLWGWGRWALFRPLVKKLAVVTLFVFLIFLPLLLSYQMGSGSGTAVDEDWQEALTYIRDNTSKDAVIMTWWGYGYWILDLGERRPVVDNGYFGWDEQRLTDIKTVYLSTDTTEAVQVMQKYGASYLIFSKIDEYSAPGIISWPNMPKQIDGKWEEFPEDSLVARSLDNDFQSEGVLKVVYRNTGVVILGLTQR